MSPGSDADVVAGAAEVTPEAVEAVSVVAPLPSPPPSAKNAPTPPITATAATMPMMSPALLLGCGLGCAYDAGPIDMGAAAVTATGAGGGGASTTGASSGGGASIGPPIPPPPMFMRSSTALLPLRLPPPRPRSRTASSLDEPFAAFSVAVSADSEKSTEFSLRSPSLPAGVGGFGRCFSGSRGWFSAAAWNTSTEGRSARAARRAAVG